MNFSLVVLLLLNRLKILPYRHVFIEIKFRFISNISYIQYFPFFWIYYFVGNLKFTNSDLEGGNIQSVLLDRVDPFKMQAQTGLENIQFDFLRQSHLNNQI